MPSPRFLALESTLSRAHFDVYRAEVIAAELGLSGLEEDLWELLTELTRLQMSLASGPTRLPKSLSRRA
jgi:hypothetical protein